MPAKCEHSCHSLNHQQEMIMNIMNIRLGTTSDATNTFNYSLIKNSEGFALPLTDNNVAQFCVECARPPSQLVKRGGEM